MGFFSWVTSDTKKSIANQYSLRSTFPVHMITEDGQIFTENNYDGYGVFGGKDIYVLAAEMNGYKGDTDEETRNLFFDKIWVRGITKEGKKYIHKEHFNRYDEPLESEGGLNPNDLVEKHGWVSYGNGGEFEEWANQGLKMPKLVEHLPLSFSIQNWIVKWNELPYPESCRDQGFFYDDYEDDDEEDELSTFAAPTNDEGDE
jgi:hypothetical protein